MDISVTIDMSFDNSEAFKGILKQEVNKALYASALQVEKVAKKSIADSRGKSGGRFYKRRSVLHQASAPGEPPASDTGRLVNSINSYLNGSELYSFVIAGLGSVKYALMLEFGTRKMAARPFMQPALEASRAWINDRLAQATTSAIATFKK